MVSPAGVCARCLLSLSESPNLRSNLQSASVQAAVMVDAGVGVRVLALILDDLAADAAFAVHPLRLAFCGHAAVYHNPVFRRDTSQLLQSEKASALNSGSRYAELLASLAAGQPVMVRQPN